ncbi:hypothetical protein [Lysinibacillus xylanilyticus]|uniref:Uncharacterized protein n=1 Tax=Lysinibacillus xylanilyticus TaxID=582475 RepID=A0ABV3VQV4_9BACI
MIPLKNYQFHTTSCSIPFNPPTTKATCICCGNEAERTVWFAQAY